MTLARAYGGLRVTVETVTWMLTGVLVLLVSANVFARYVLEIGIGWAEEISRLAFVWTVFLGAYVALCRKGHMAIELGLNAVPPAARPAFLALSRIFVLVFLAVLIWAGAKLVIATVGFGRQSPMLGISAAWGYLAVPVAGVLMFLEALRSLFAGEPPATEQEAAAAAPEAAA